MPILLIFGSICPPLMLKGFWEEKSNPGQTVFLKFNQQAASYWCSSAAAASTLIPLAAQQSLFLLLSSRGLTAAAAASSILLPVSTATFRKPGWWLGSVDSLTEVRESLSG